MRLGKGRLRSCFGFDGTASRREIRKGREIRIRTRFKRMMWVGGRPRRQQQLIQFNNSQSHCLLPQQVGAGPFGGLCGRG